MEGLEESGGGDGSFASSFSSLAPLLPLATALSSSSSSLFFLLLSLLLPALLLLLQQGPLFLPQIQLFLGASCQLSFMLILTLT